VTNLALVWRLVCIVTASHVNLNVPLHWLLTNARVIIFPRTTKTSSGSSVLTGRRRRGYLCLTIDYRIQSRGFCVWLRVAFRFRFRRTSEFWDIAVGLFMPDNAACSTCTYPIVGTVAKQVAILSAFWTFQVDLGTSLILTWVEYKTTKLTKLDRSGYNPVGLLGLDPLHVNRCINIQPQLTYFKDLRDRLFSLNPTLLVPLLSHRWNVPVG